MSRPAADSPYDLPVYFRLMTGRRHDSVSCAITYGVCQRIYLDWKIGIAPLDSAHDNDPIYQGQRNIRLT